MSDREPRAETGFLVLVRERISGSWIVFTHSEARCPIMFLSRERAAGIADAVCGKGVADMGLVVEVLTPLEPGSMTSDWNEVSERSRELSRREVAAQRQATPPALLGYLVCGAYPEGDLWGVATVNRQPWFLETETEAEELREKIASEGKHAVVYTIVHRGQPTEVRGISH
jgi:hypothetical protein